MRKVSGFTIIELMVVVGLIGLMVAINAPNFLEEQDRSKFSNQAKLFFERIAEARANALSSKKCGLQPSTWWGIEFHSDNDRYIFRCNQKNVPGEETVIFDPTILDIESVAYPPEAGNPNRARIIFSSGTGKASIEDLTGQDPVNDFAGIDLDRKTYIEIVLAFNADHKKKICFDAVAGFPTSSDDRHQTTCRE